MHSAARMSVRREVCDVASSLFDTFNFNTPSSDGLFPLDGALISRRKIVQFNQQGCLARLDQWLTNRTTLSIAKKLMKKGALYNVARYTALCDELDHLETLADGARVARLAANVDSSNPLIRDFASYRFGIRPPFLYGRNLRAKILPQLR